MSGGLPRRGMPSCSARTNARRMAISSRAVYVCVPSSRKAAANRTWSITHASTSASRRSSVNTYQSCARLLPLNDATMFLTICLISSLVFSSLMTPRDRAVRVPTAGRRNCAACDPGWLRTCFRGVADRTDRADFVVPRTQVAHYPGVLRWSSRQAADGRLRERREPDTTEQLHFHFSISCTGEGNGNPLQYSCLKNPKDGGAWWAAVYGVAQSRTRLKRLSSSSSSRESYSQIGLVIFKVAKGASLVAQW